MSSSDSLSSHRIFRLKPDIFMEKDLKTCFENLAINENDLIITGSSLLQKIKETNRAKQATILETKKYGTGEPHESWVDQILEESNKKDFHRVIAIGGGGIIDIAKFCVFGDGRSIHQLFNDKEKLNKNRELIAIPTTCGTGSEVTSVAVVEIETLKSKLGLQIDALFPDKSILIGDMLENLPYSVFANTSIDALVHAIESLLSPKANVYTDLFAKKAIQIIVYNFLEIDGKQCLPNNLQNALIAANMAGIAFSIAGCATMHALSFPLGARYHLAHGEAVYAVMCSTLNYYKNIGVSLDKLEESLKDLLPDSRDRVKDMVALLRRNHLEPSFEKMNITEPECRDMAKLVYEKQQRLLVNSPRELSEKDLEIIYKNCLKKERT